MEKIVCRFFVGLIKPFPILSDIYGSLSKKVLDRYILNFEWPLNAIYTKFHKECKFFRRMRLNLRGCNSNSGDAQSVPQKLIWARNNGK